MIPQRSKLTDVAGNPGRVIEHPITGERIVVRESGRFTVVAGPMRFRLGRRTIAAQPGDTVRIRRTKRLIPRLL